MRAIVYKRGKVRMEEIGLHPLNPEWSRIKVTRSGLCGSDVAKMSLDELPSGHTAVLGHEFCGIVTEVNSSSSTLSVGDRVVGMPLLACGSCESCQRHQENLCKDAQAIGRTIQGSYAEYVDAPITNVFRINDERVLDPYVLADPLAVCIHASRFVDSVGQCLVIGDGSIGCLLAWLLDKRGNDVWLKGIHHENLSFINGYGIKGVIDSSASMQFDTVFEAVGRSQPDSLNECIQRVRRSGNIVVLGVYASGYSYSLNARNLFIDEVSLVGSNAYVRSDFLEALRLIELHYDELIRFVSHKIAFERFNDALGIAKAKQDFTMKIVIESEGE